MIEVKVPATSANLGCGFDCLGVALKQYMTVRFTKTDEFSIKGCPSEYCNRNNLIMQAFDKVVEKVNGNPFPVSVEVESEIPASRGMGSSAACIVAGAVGANALLNNPFNRYELFALCVELEGHPDNVAPALFGNLTVSFMDEDRKPNMITYSVDSHLLYVLMIPPYKTETKAARRLLPDTMSYKDAVYQIGHACAFAKAMEMGNAVIIKKAGIDKMHEPYRSISIPEYAAIKNIAKESGALTTLLSGSGPTMIAICDTIEASEKIKEAMQKQFNTWDIRVCCTAYEGVKVKEL